MLPQRKLTDRQLLYFGGSLTLMLLMVAGIVYSRFGNALIATVISAVAIVIGAVFFVVPNARTPIHDAFHVVTRPIHWIVTVVLLSIVYFAIVTPIGLLLRLSGYDPLSRSKPDASDEQSSQGDQTYWQPRQKADSKEQYFKTY